MSGKAFIIVGGTGSGKTTFAKRCLEKVHPQARLVYDVNKEYTELYPYPFDPRFEKFLDKADSVSNAFILFEEATIFLSNRSSSDIVRSILVRKRHTNNTIFLVFHSFRAIPRYIFDLCNYIVIHKTNDSATLIKNNFDNELLSELTDLIRNADWHINSEGKKYSPSVIYDIYGQT